MKSFAVSSCFFWFFFHSCFFLFTCHFLLFFFPFPSFFPLCFQHLLQYRTHDITLWFMYSADLTIRNDSTSVQSFDYNYSFLLLLHLNAMFIKVIDTDVVCLCWLFWTLHMGPLLFLSLIQFIVCNENQLWFKRDFKQTSFTLMNSRLRAVSLLIYDLVC